MYDESSINEYRNPHRAPFSNSRQWRLVLRRQGSSVSRGSRQRSHSVVPHRSPDAQIPKDRERDRLSCHVLGYGCHPHRGMTTAPQCTYRYLTEAITRCHQGHTHPTGSGILVYDSITSFIIQDSGVNAPKFCSTERARPFSASAPLPQMCVCPAAPLAGIPVEASTIGFFAQTRCNFAQMLCRTCALRSARLMRCGAEIC